MKKNRIASALIAATICLSVCGCGEKKDDFAEYGNMEAGESASVSSEEVTNPQQDAMTADNTEKSGDSDTTEEQENINYVNGKDTPVTSEEISWKDTGYSVKGVDLCPSVERSTVFIGEPKIYEGHEVGDFKESEEKIVNSIFGGTGKKLESIAYKDATSYITFLYKYRLLTLKFQDNSEFSEDDYKDVYRENGLPINSSFQDTYKWIDNDKYSIHMYEGTYENTRFGLLLAYDYLTKTRYIFFDPIAIDEYLPGCQYKTMNISAGYDALGKVIETENNCKYSSDEVKHMAAELLGCFEIENAESDLSNDYSMYSMATWPLASWNVAAMVGGTPVESYTGDSEDAMCSLVFSDADCYTMATNDGKVTPSAGYHRLAEQYYDLPESTDFDRFVENNTGRSTEGVNYTTDGYAVFLNSDFSDFSYYNAGVVKVTSKGIYGADIVQSVVVDSITDNIELMDFDGIKDSLVKELDKNLDMDKLDNPDKLKIPMAYFSMGQIESADKKDGSCTFVPCWIFIVSGSDKSADVSINAVDGTIVNINYYDYCIE
jgi:hypothetical protein